MARLYRSFTATFKLKAVSMLLLEACYSWNIDEIVLCGRGWWIQLWCVDTAPISKAQPRASKKSRSCKLGTTGLNEKSTF